MKNALVLGGSKGLGLEIGKLLVAEGYKLVIAARSADQSPLVRDHAAIGHTVDLEAGEVHNLAYMGPYDVIAWTAGAYQEGALIDQRETQIRQICRNHVEGPAVFLVPHLRRNRDEKRPVHLVVVASSSSYRVRRGEGLYGTLKAAKAQLARTLGAELPELIPGSMVMLANPGGMRTPFWEGRDQPKLASFMDPVAVAAAIWSEMKAQEQPFIEIHVDRQSDGTPKVERGTRAPVMP